MQVQQIQDVHSAQRVAQPSAELRIGSTGDVMAMAAPKRALVETGHSWRETEAESAMAMGDSMMIQQKRTFEPWTCTGDMDRYGRYACL